jgi:glycosyltransferase involved in cell wall biosynthesis
MAKEALNGWLQLFASGFQRIRGHDLMAKKTIKNARPLLSICVPTFNRAEHLNRLLASISKEREGVERLVEVCISDNASTDRTQGIIREWKKKMPLSSGRNPKNFGFDVNIVKVTRLAHGRFVWYIGDDDVIVEGALQGFLENLKKAQKMAVNAIFVSCAHRIIDSRTVPLNFTELRVFPKSSLTKFLLGINYIGAICVSRKAALEIINKQTILSPPVVLKKYKNRFHLHDFIHTYIFLECLSRYGCFAIEPQARVSAIDDGSTFTYERFVYRFIIHMLAMIDILRCYKWVKKLLPLDTLNGNLVRAAMAADRPELEGTYLACQYLAGRFHLLNNDKGSFFATGTYYTLRKSAVFSNCLILFMRIFIMLGRPIRISRTPIDEPELKKKLEFCSLIVECMQKGEYLKPGRFRW